MIYPIFFIFFTLKNRKAKLIEEIKPILAKGRAYIYIPLAYIYVQIGHATFFMVL